MNETIIRNTFIANTFWNIAEIENISIVKTNQTFTIGFLALYGTFSLEFLKEASSVLYPSFGQYAYQSDGCPNITTRKIIISSYKLKKVFNNLNWFIVTSEDDIPTNCFHCRIEFTGDICPVGQYKFTCLSCYLEKYDECDNCEKIQNIIESNQIITESGNSYCENCRDEDASLCFYCNSDECYYDGDDWQEVNCEIYCNSCYNESYTNCWGCDTAIERDEVTFCEDEEENFCSDCFDTHSCNSLHLSSGSSYSPTGIRNEIYYLPDIENNNENSSPYRHNGYFQPDNLVFYKGKKTEFLGSNRFVGVEIEVERGTYDIAIKNDLPANSTIKSDGSVMGFELNTPPASGDKLEQIVKQSCEALRKYQYQGTKSCGVHIHIDARDIRNKPNKIANIARTYLAIEDMIFSILPSSRWTSQYCQPIKADFLFSGTGADEKWFAKNKRVTMQQIKRGKGLSDRYHGLNIKALQNSRGTLELRYHSGTTSSTKILNWIALNLRLFTYAVDNYNAQEIEKLFAMETGQEKFELFCETFKLPNELKKYLAKRASIFNPEWTIKFNKGQIERNIEGSIALQYTKLLKKEETKIRKEVFVKIKKELQLKYGAKWKNYFDKQRVASQAIVASNSMIRKHIKSKFGDINSIKSFGLISKNELNTQIKLLQRGMLLSINKESGISQDDEFENEIGGLIS